MNNPTWYSFGISHVGKRRKINQDAFANLPEKQIWVVADGMGGHKSGELASNAIVDSLKALQPAKTIGSTVKAIYRELLTVNQNLLNLVADGSQDDVIGSTVVILLACNRHCVYLWSGDSRIYLFRDGQLRQISRDHNNGSMLQDKGFSNAEIMAFPFAQTLTHAIGAEKDIFFNAQIQEIMPGDTFLLCSDGLNKEVADSEIENMLNTEPVAQVVSKLIELALERGSRDNVTVVLAQTSVEQT